ncbi:MAG: hypothetical protein RLY35_674, partial [Bacteroidota bacterium]
MKSYWLKIIVFVFLTCPFMDVYAGTGFVGGHASSAWTFYQDAGGNGLRTITTSMLTLKGSNALQFNLIETRVTMVAPLSGNYTFTWQHTTLDNALYEDAAYYINNFYYPITEGNPATSATGSITMYATAGTTIGFAIFSNDDAYGASTLRITNFNWPDAVVGCTNATACNYNPAANVSAACTFPAQYYNCSNQCLLDSDGDGICNQLEVVGCMNMSACNYAYNATDAGPCTFAQTYYNCSGSCINDS